MNSVFAQNNVNSVYITKLSERLLSVLSGDTVTYRELSNAIGRDIASGDRYLLNQARKKLLEEYRIRFDAVNGIGLRRVPDEEVARGGPKSIRRVRHAARRERKKNLAISDWERLSNDDKVRNNVTVALLGTIENSATVKGMKKIEKKIVNSGALPPIDLEELKKL